MKLPNRNIAFKVSNQLDISFILDILLSKNIDEVVESYLYQIPALECIFLPEEKSHLEEKFNIGWVYYNQVNSDLYGLVGFDDLEQMDPRKRYSNMDYYIIDIRLVQREKKLGRILCGD